MKKKKKKVLYESNMGGGFFAFEVRYYDPWPSLFNCNKNLVKKIKRIRILSQINYALNFYFFL